MFSSTEQTNLLQQKSNQILPRAGSIGFIAKGQGRPSGVDRNVLYTNQEGGYTGVHIYQTKHLKQVHFIVCEFYFNKIEDNHYITLVISSDTRSKIILPGQKASVPAHLLSSSYPILFLSLFPFLLLYLCISISRK